MVTDYEEGKDNGRRGPSASMDVLYRPQLVSTRCVYKCQSQTRRGWGNNKEYMTGTHPLPCNTVVHAQAWNLLNMDPVADEERWRYHYLMEIFKDDVTCNCLGDLPSDNMFDVKGTLIQEKFKLYEANPLTPLARDAFEPIPRRHEAPGDAKVGTSCIILGRRRRRWYKIPK